MSTRSFFKQIYRYTRSRSYRHSEKIWPYIQIKRPEDSVMGTMSYRGQPIEVIPIDSLKAHHADDLVILASGPSIKQLDLQGLKHADWLAVNGAINLLSSYPNKDLKYYVVLDQGFVSDRINIIQQVVANQDIVVFTNLFCLHIMYQLLGKEAVQAQVVIFEDRQLPVYLPKRDSQTLEALSQNQNEHLIWDAKQEVGYSLDLNRGYVCGRTVVYMALQIASHLGYRRVFLAGVDMTRFHEPRFYEQAETRLSTKLDLEFEQAIYPSFQLASQVYQHLGIQAYNLCLDSGLDDSIFPRVELTEQLCSNSTEK